MKKLLIAVMLLGIITANAQESLDPWYGESIQNLEQSIISHNEEYRIDTFSNGSIVLTMKDFRWVSVAYVSFDNGKTIEYRVDYYSELEYVKRISYIKTVWSEYKGNYILNKELVAIPREEDFSITFVPISHIKGNVVP